MKRPQKYTRKRSSVSLFKHFHVNWCVCNMEDGDSWVTKLKDYNRRHGRDPTEQSPLVSGGDTPLDKKLLEESYVQMKGDTSQKYSIIPKFYSKVHFGAQLPLPELGSIHAAEMPVNSPSIP